IGKVLAIVDMEEVAWHGVFFAASGSTVCLSAIDAQWSLSAMCRRCFQHIPECLCTIPYRCSVPSAPECRPFGLKRSLSTRPGPDWDARRDVLGGSLGFGESAGASFSVWMAPSGR